MDEKQKINYLITRLYNDKLFLLLTLMAKLLNVGNTCAINALLQCINTCKITD